MGKVAADIAHYSANRTRLERYVVFDIETVGRENAGHLIPEPTAPGNLRDPQKIADAIEARRAEQIERMALDINLNRIVSIGIQTHEMSEPRVYTCPDDEAEAQALSLLWSAFRADYMLTAPFIGFFCRKFDLPVCLRRTQLLGMPEPALSLERYRNEHVIDLHERLTFGIYNESGVMKRNLKSFSELFGIEHDQDDCDGADIGELVAANDWQAVVRHCKADVSRTHALAQRLGVI